MIDHYLVFNFFEGLAFTSDAIILLEVTLQLSTSAIKLLKVISSIKGPNRGIS